MKKQHKRILKFILFCIFLLIMSLIIINKRTLKLVSKYIEYYNLKSELKLLDAEKQDYKEFLYLLKNKPRYIQKIAKSKLNLIEENEVVYIVEDKKDEK